MKVASEIKVGVVIVVASSLLYVGYNILRGQGFFDTSKIYYSVYNTVDGLTPGNPVQVSGYTVGKVSSIEFHPTEMGKVIVGFSVAESSLKIPSGSVARIANLDLLGSKAIVLEFNQSSTTFVNPNDTLLGANQNSLQEEVNVTILPLKMKAEELLSELDSAIRIVQLILNEDARENLGASFESFKRTFTTLENVAVGADSFLIKETGKIDNVMSNFESITGNLRRSNEKISIILDNASKISDSLAASNIPSTLKTVDKTMNELSAVIEKVNNGEGSLGLLLQDDSLYINIDQAMLELDKLLEDVRVNPRRYVNVSIFGGKDKSNYDPNKKDRSKVRNDIKKKRKEQENETQ